MTTSDATPDTTADSCSPPGSLPALLVRTADCLTAYLRTPTASAGLNESRHKVLDALRRMPSESSAQSELAQALLQSESNLSTLLDRMQHDGLISRVRSEIDRRKSLIRLTPTGREALECADRERSRAAARVVRVLDEDRLSVLCAALEQLLERIEDALGIAVSDRKSAVLAADGPAPPIPAPHILLAGAANSFEFSRGTNGQSP